MSQPKVLATNLGFPRIGAQRELKKAVEAFWAGKLPADGLLQEAASLRQRHWKLQQAAGLDHIPSNDFALYDHMLDMSLALGAIPSRYAQLVPATSAAPTTEELLPLQFAMARGSQRDGVDVTAMEMTKWFDTNYHYIVPEFEETTEFRLLATKMFDQFAEAKALGIVTRPVIVGPVTYVLLGKAKHAAHDPRRVLEKVLPVYAEILAKFAALGAEWVQIDEPVLAAFDLTPEQLALFDVAYTQTLSRSFGSLKVLLATYFDELRQHTEVAAALPVHAIHVDLCRTPGRANTTANNAAAALRSLVDAVKATPKIVSLGVVDGRNIWKNNLRESIGLVSTAVEALGADRVFVAASSSLQHTPVDLANETKLDASFKSWLAFATQKLDEIALVARGASNKDSVTAELAASDAVVEDRRTSSKIHSAAVAARVAAVTDAMYQRKSARPAREAAQAAAFNLPAFPTTTIGSFPQTADIRSARASLKAGRLDNAAYTKLMEEEIKRVVEFQERVDIDVLVHGEPERNDMVEYFGEQLSGFFFTQNGWVQSYGSRCVKPPVIFGDVSRPAPMTVQWSKFAQSLTKRPMKGMLTGPVTILQWSFVRDDQPREATSRQIALAIRDEVADLERAGIFVIQIDEAAVREGLPLRRSDRGEYLRWAVDSFRLSSSTVEDTTQIHTHMCYSDFNEIIDDVARMDTDCISIETSRAQMVLLDAFVRFKYPSHIGPGVYDIHSPRVPSKEEMTALLRKALAVLPATAIWVNPDCGLKTRGWPEVEAALANMVAAAKEIRAAQ